MSSVCFLIPFFLCVLFVLNTVLLCPRVWISLENGHVTANPPGPPVEGTTLHYSCHTGFNLEGRNTSHCTKLGKWDSPKPTCLCKFPLRLIVLKTVCIFALVKTKKKSSKTHISNAKAKQNKAEGKLFNELI